MPIDFNPQTMFYYTPNVAQRIVQTQLQMPPQLAQDTFTKSVKVDNKNID
jgi:hypothetical protein